MPFRLCLLPGTVIAFDKLPRLSIALDGAVLGCRIDPTGYRFSFDHHEGLRFPQLATCEQVCLAIELGLDPGRIENVFINDLDRDVAAALWLLRHPNQATAVRERITGLGRVDSHGPGAPGGLTTPGLQAWLPGRGTPIDEAAAERAIIGIGVWLDGRLPEAGHAMQDGEAILLPDLQRVPAPQGAAGLYRDGHAAFVLLRALRDGVWQYTICKRSDFHPSNIVGMAVRIAHHEQGWGGTSTLLGSPRPSGSRLSPDELIRIIREV